MAARDRRRRVGAVPPARFGAGAFPARGESLRAARKLESLIKLWDVEPANELLSEPTKNEAYLAARPGVAYALYFTNGGSVGLDLGKAAGPFDVRWIDIGTGDWARRETIQGGSVVTLKAPAKGHWVAAIVRPTPTR